MTIPIPNVSVVIPAYHAERFIARAIQSVLDQPGVEPEIIVVVDGAVDRTAEIARGFAKAEVVINEVNQGAPAARNRGLAMAQAPYVMFLDADDWVEGPLLQGLVEAMDNLNADIGFGPFRKEFNTGQAPRLIKLHPRDTKLGIKIKNHDLMILFLTGFFINPCATMWRTKFIREQDGWNKSLINSQDFEIVHRCLIRGAETVLTGRGCGVYFTDSRKDRITLNYSRSRWKSQIMALNLITEEARSKGCFDERLEKACAQYVESYLRLCAREGDYQSYRDMRIMFRKLGGRYYSRGSWFHRLGSHIFGLRNKERLSIQLRKLKKIIFS